mmetsp:Transcript_98356/g.300754  ORF Transcript_98356/g.300754 Transcript_98356/m.300754 type:complete len:310 (-) Transcript_98356:926-1855(-)
MVEVEGLHAHQRQVAESVEQTHEKHFHLDQGKLALQRLDSLLLLRGELAVRNHSRVVVHEAFQSIRRKVLHELRQQDCLELELFVVGIVRRQRDPQPVKVQQSPLPIERASHSQAFCHAGFVLCLDRSQHLRQAEWALHRGVPLVSGDIVKAVLSQQSLMRRRVLAGRIVDLIRSGPRGLQLDLVHDGVVAHAEDAPLAGHVELLTFALLGRDVHEIALARGVFRKAEDDGPDGAVGLPRHQVPRAQVRNDQAFRQQCALCALPLLVAESERLVASIWRLGNRENDQLETAFGGPAHSLVAALQAKRGM